MKNSLMIKRLRRSLLRQLLFPTLLLIITMAVLSRIPRENYFSPRPLNSKSRYENFYNRDLPYVSVTVPELAYTGLSYTVNGLTEGYYYYTLNDGFCQFYLLDKEMGDPAEPEKGPLSLKGRLIRLDDAQYHGLISEIATELDWTASALEKMASPYAISALPHPFYLNLLFHLLAYISVILSLSDLISGLIYLWKPLRAPAFRYLGSPDAVRLLLPKAELELKHASLARAGQLTLTPSYLISAGAGRELILPRHSIVWVYSHSRMRRLSGLRMKLSSTLHAVAEDGRSYDFPRTKKEELDQMLELLKSSGDELLIGYSEKNKKAARHWLRERRRAG